MEAIFESLLPPLFGLAAVLYLGLAAYVSRSAPDSLVAFFLFLIGIMIAGTAFSYGTDDQTLYGIGRTLAFFSAGFLPVAFYMIYRQYTEGPASSLMIAILSIIPITTTVLCLTNSMHNIIWDTVITETGVVFTDLTEHYWFNWVHAPFAYGLFAFSLVALAGRLPSIAPAHRRTVIVFVGSAILPFTISIANRFLGVGPPDFPFLSLT